MEQKLLKLGFNLKSRGFEYWLEAIQLYKKKSMKIMDLYGYLADKYDTDVMAIERCMRFCINPARENIIKKTGYNGKMTNGTFLRLVKTKII